MFSQLAFIQSIDGLPFKLMATGKELKYIGIRDNDKPEDVITFVEGLKGKTAFKQPLTMNININKIGKIAGSWKGQIRIDN